MIRWVAVPLFLATLGLTSCGGCGRADNGSGVSSSASSAAFQGPDLNLIKIRPGDKVALDSPEAFVQVYILFNFDLMKWQREIESNTNMTESPESYLARKREAFYASYGLTEERFTQYGSAHFKEIEDFLDRNPDYRKAYEDSLK